MKYIKIKSTINSNVIAVSDRLLTTAKETYTGITYAYNNRL